MFYCDANMHKIFDRNFMGILISDRYLEVWTKYWVTYMIVYKKVLLSVWTKELIFYQCSLSIPLQESGNQRGIEKKLIWWVNK